VKRSKKKFHRLLDDTVAKAASVGMTLGMLWINPNADFYLIQKPEGNVIRTGKLPEIRSLVERYCKLKAFL
jgi:hypothetical protein